MARDTDFIVYVLRERGMLSDEQLATAKKFAEDTQGKMDIVDAIKALKFIHEDEFREFLAAEYGMDVIDLKNYVIPDEIVTSLPPDIVINYKIIPVMKHDDILTVAMSDPTDMSKLDSLRYLLGADVDAVIAPEDQINKIIDARFRSLAENVEKLIGEVDDGGISFSGSLTGEDEEDDEAPVNRLVAMVIGDAYRMRASDIHLEPMEKTYRIRYRIDGALREVDAPPKALQAVFTSRVKIMARLDITEKRIPQDGRIQISVDGNDIDLRVSSIPTTHGESIVMRILDKSSIQLDIPKLGFYADDLELVNRSISMPDGIFLVTGPTGSGKTTSLYAFLNTINTTARKIITVEDPVEYQLAGINQVQVIKEINLTFAAALRSMLRQAPNIIMVGEIRDVETAEIAINAALTGHLVFSTLHTNDAPSAVTRLVDMGVKPFLVATSVRAIMAQRLLRRVCPNCKIEHEPTNLERKMLGFSDEYLVNHKFYRGAGCRQCGMTGYKGRIGIYEIFIIDEDISTLIFRNEPANVIREAARRLGMRSLRDDALRKAEAGTSTLEEVIRNTMMDEE